SMKKTLLIIVGVGLIGGAVYYFTKGTPPSVTEGNGPETSDSPKAYRGDDGAPKADKASEDTKDTGTSVGSVAPSRPGLVTPSAIALGGRDRPLTEEEMDQLEAYYERTEKEWDQLVSGMFKEFGLPAQAFGEYEKLREGHEEAKMDAFQEYHNKMIEKYGDSY